MTTSSAPARVPAGDVIELLGSVVRARTSSPLGLGEIVQVGDERLLAEVVALEADVAALQVYEPIAGLRAGAPVFATGRPLEVELGPGLLGRVFDGVQRPLERIALAHGDFVLRGLALPALDPERAWAFEPRVAAGAPVEPGVVLGVVPETAAIEHRVLCPPGVTGRVRSIAPAGSCRVHDTVAVVELATGTLEDVSMSHKWPVRVPRPFAAQLPHAVPLITGQRLLDTFFPLMQGGAAGMPGGFGTGKTVLQHQLCKWSRADVIVFVGCGERGNEVADVLCELPALVDPRTGRSLSDRTVIIANTSDMPVPAREASIYCAITIAEYFRDMGYTALLLADSTSRWAEALREISGRLEEMPAEEGYPPYLSSRLAAFYERARRVRTSGGLEGSVTVVSAVSPPGGDLTEPVSRHTQRFTRCFWALDRTLAHARRFPAVALRDSYGEAGDAVAGWWAAHVAPDWPDLRREALALLDEAERLEGTARLVGVIGLPEPQQLTLGFASVLDEGFLRQQAFDPVDQWCSPEKQVALLRMLLTIRRRAAEAIGHGVPARDLLAVASIGDAVRARATVDEASIPSLAAIAARFDADVAALERRAAAPAGVSP
jgi:V/A-type H+-transporting ATPase subunit A